MIWTQAEFSSSYGWDATLPPRVVGNRHRSGPLVGWQVRGSPAARMDQTWASKRRVAMQRILRTDWDVLQGLRWSLHTLSALTDGTAAGRGTNCELGAILVAVRLEFRLSENRT
jgi:hypothetical protein